MRRTMSSGEMRMEMAEYGRDAKREEAMCAHGGCTSSHGLKDAPDGYRGRYGGHKLCEEHYEQVVDNLLEHLKKHDCAPWETNWYMATFPDKGAGATRSHAYIEASTEQQARDIAKEQEWFEMYDTSKGTVEKCGESKDDISNGLLRGGPNVAFQQNGEKIGRYDLQ